MRRIVAVVVAVSLSFTALPLFAAARAGRMAQQAGTISGTAKDSAGQPIARATVQLRNLTTGELVSTTQSAADGGFSFAGLPAGTYAVEIVDAAGKIIGVSASISVAAGATITGVSVSATAALAAAGAAAGISTALIVVTAAGAAGVIGLVVAANRPPASPSR